MSSHVISSVPAKYLLGQPAILLEIRIPDKGVAPKGRSGTSHSPAGALHPNAAAGPSTSLSLPQVTPPAPSLVPSGYSPGASPQGGTITLDQMLLSSLLDNHKMELLGVVKAQKVAMQEWIGCKIKGHLDELHTMHQKTIQEEVKAAIKSLLKDLQKHADDKIIAGLNTGMQAIQDSIAWGLEETKTKIEGGMLRSLADELSKSNDNVVKRVSDDLVKRVSDNVVKRVSDDLNTDDGRLGKILRIAESGMQGLSSKLDSQESSVTARLNSLQTIASRYHTLASVIEKVLRPLRDSVNSLQSEIPLLDLIKINTSRILDIIQLPRPKGDAQVEVHLVVHCMWILILIS
jgi:hypothetical protein